MPNSVQITNVESGDVIPQAFSLSVDYENATGSTATVIVTCAHVAVTPQQAPGPSGTLSFDFAHAAAHADISFSTSMLNADSEQVALDDVELVDVSNAPPITFTIGFSLTTLSAAELTGPLAGKWDATKGDRVVVIVQRIRKGRRRPIVFVNRATLGNPMADDWSHVALPAFPNGKYVLRAVLTNNGRLVAAVSRRFNRP